jgi:hypothetical protein
MVVADDVQRTGCQLWWGTVGHAKIASIGHVLTYSPIYKFDIGPELFYQLHGRF